MKRDQIDGDGYQQRCQVAGDVIERALPAAQPALDAAGWDRLRGALLGPTSAAHAGRRRRALLATFAALAIGGAAALYMVRARPITFVVQGGTVDKDGTGAGDGRVETADGQRAALRFSDGSRVALAGASVGRVVARTADGASFSVERGRARFDVVHRAHTRWTVTAGPFEVLVTGTSFDVDWSPAQTRTLAVELHAGSVTVRGGPAGGGVSLRAGQRLVADVDGARVTVRSGLDAPASAEAATPPPMAGGAASAIDPEAAAGDEAGDRGDRGGRARGGRVSPPSSARVEGTAAPASGLAIEAPRAPLPGIEPAPWPAPPLAAETKLAAGGAACLGWSPQIRFDRLDRALDGVEVASAMSLAFTRPAIDHARSWCGAGSLRVDARFDLAGAPNRLGHRPRHAGEVLVGLPEPVDLTGRTVTVHFFVEGPPDIRFAAQLFAIDRPGSGDAKWVGGGFTPGFTSGRWSTLTHAFERDNRLFEGGTSSVDRVERISLQVYAIGQDRVWTGRVFVDDIGWQ